MINCLDSVWKIKSAIVVLVLLSTLSANETMTITAARGNRQTFAGLGISEIGEHSSGYGALSAARKQEILRLMVTDLNLRIYRIWDINDNASFCNDAAAMVPMQFLYSSGSASDIVQWENRTGLKIAATGIANEPNMPHPNIQPDAMKNMVKSLRTDLNNRGLQRIKIIAAESVEGPAQQAAPNFHDDDIRYFDALKNDPAAWNALGGFATHSYGQGAKEVYASQLQADGTKDFWMTEHSVPGPEQPGNVPYGVTSLATCMGDLNHMVTHWIYFIGFGANGFNDNDAGTKMITFDNSRGGTDWIHFHTKYYYFKHLVSAIKPGAVMRKCTANKALPTADMEWANYNEPAVIGICGKNTDNTWAIALVNLTGLHTRWVSGYQVDYTTAEAKVYDVTVEIAELAGTGTRYFTKKRTTGATTTIDPEQVVMTNGSVTVSVSSLELLTLQGISSEPVVPDTTKLTSGVLEAEAAARLMGMQSKGTVLGFGDPGDYAFYDNVDFKGGFLRLAITYGVPADQAGNTVEFHLDSLTGPLAGTLTTQSSGGWDAMRSDTVNLQGVSGLRDLYVVLKVVQNGTLYIADLDKYTFLSSVPTRTSGQLIQNKKSMVPVRRLIGNQILLRQNNRDFTIQGKRVVSSKYSIKK